MPALRVAPSERRPHDFRELHDLERCQIGSGYRGVAEAPVGPRPLEIDDRQARRQDLQAMLCDVYRARIGTVRQRARFGHGGPLSPAVDPSSVDTGREHERCQDGYASKIRIYKSFPERAEPAAGADRARLPGIRASCLTAAATSLAPEGNCP